MLNRFSPRVVQPTGYGTLLFDHQLASLHALQRLEDSLTGSPVSLQSEENAWLETNIAIVGDKPGSGKSDIALASIYRSPVLTERFIRSSSSCDGRVVARKRAKIEPLGTNLILAPRGTVPQWRAYITNAFDASWKVFSAGDGSPTDESAWSRIIGGEYDIVVLSEGAYDKLQQHPRFNAVGFQRFVVDEADRIRVNKMKMPLAAFMLLLSSSPETILQGKSKLSCFNDIFKDATSDLSDMIVVRNDDGFVDASCRLPSYNIRVVKVPNPPHQFSDLAKQGVITPDVLRLLNACDYVAAAFRIGCNIQLSEDGVFAALSAHLRLEKQGLLHKRTLVAPDAVASVDDAVRGIEARMQFLSDHLARMDCDPITLEPYAGTKAYARCCRAAYDMDSILKSIEMRGNVCPMCRSVLLPNDLVVLSDNKTPKRIPPPTKMRVAVAEIKAVLEELGDKCRVLVFSDHSFDALKTELSRESIPHRQPKGNTPTVEKALRDFRERQGMVLLLNAEHCGVGVNLEVVTHIFTLHDMEASAFNQLVGRAQRHGRTCPLEVVKILYKHEV